MAFRANDVFARSRNVCPPLGEGSDGHEPIFFADFVHDYPDVGGVREYSVRLFRVLRARYGDRLRSLRAIEHTLGAIDPRWTYLDRERVALQRLALEQPGALVISPNFQSPVSPSAPCRLRIVNVVHDVPHESLPAEYHNAHHVRIDGLYRETLANADHIAFVSDVTRRHFYARYGAPRASSVVAPVMDVPVRGTPRNRENFLLAVAHFEFHEHKNFGGLIALFERLAARDPELRLVLTGRGRHLFEATLARIDPAVRARIDHRGFVPKAELDELYRRARAFVSLSRFEGFDMPSAEAALRGAPLILSDLPVRRELFGTSALLVDPLSPDIGAVAEFLDAPTAPIPAVGHAFPVAVMGAFSVAIEGMRADQDEPRTLLRRAPISWGARKWLRTWEPRAALLAATIAASAGFYTRWTEIAWADAGPTIGGPSNAARGDYYNGSVVAPLDVASYVGSITRLANDRQALMVTNNVLANMLKGYNEQINCSNCVTGFGAVGSVSVGFHGRKSLTQDLSVVGGIAFSDYRAGGVHVTSAPILAGLVRYDLTELGTSRPFFEAGGVLSPGQRVTSTRTYGAGLGTALGKGTTSVTGGSVFGRVGWLYRFTPQDEVAVGVELSQGWQHFGGYSESALPSNPLPLVTGGGTDRMATVRGGGQWTHLWTAQVETQFNLGVAKSFGSRSGLNSATFGGPNLVGEHAWAEYGARIGYRIQPNFVIDAFADGTLGNRPIGNTVHGGIATRYAF